MNVVFTSRGKEKAILIFIRGYVKIITTTGNANMVCKRTRFLDSYERTMNPMNVRLKLLQIPNK